jgi:hypothetical protein
LKNSEAEYRTADTHFEIHPSVFDILWFKQLYRFLLRVKAVFCFIHGHRAALRAGRRKASAAPEDARFVFTGLIAGVFIHGPRFAGMGPRRYTRKQILRPRTGFLCTEALNFGYIGQRIQLPLGEK